MPELVKCPDCGRQLRVPDDLLGKKVKCPSCAVAFTASAASDKPSKTSPTKPADTGVRKARPDEGVRKPKDDGGVMKAKALPSDDEDEDRPRPKSKARRDDDEDEDQPRPKSKAPRDEDDDDDDLPPSKRKSRRDEEEDDEEDEDRRSRRDEDDEDEDDDDDRPRKKKTRGGSRGSWAKVRTGITLVLTGVLVYIGGMVATCGITMIVVGNAASNLADRQQRSGQPIRVSGDDDDIATLGKTPMLVGVLSMVVMLTSGGLNVFGQFNCLNAPNKNGEKSLITASLGVASVCFLISLAYSVLQLTGTAAGGLDVAMTLGGILGLLMMVTYIAQAACFVYFLRAACRSIKAKGAASSANALGMVLIISVVLTVVAWGLLFMAAGVSGASSSKGAQGVGAAGGIFGCLGTCVGGVMLLVSFVWYIIALFQVRSALSRYA